MLHISRPLLLFFFLLVVLLAHFRVFRHSSHVFCVLDKYLVFFSMCHWCVCEISCGNDTISREGSMKYIKCVVKVKVYFKKWTFLRQCKVRNLSSGQPSQAAEGQIVLGGIAGLTRAKPGWGRGHLGAWARAVSTLSVVQQGASILTGGQRGGGPEISQRFNKCAQTLPSFSLLFSAPQISTRSLTRGL